MNVNGAKVGIMPNSVKMSPKTEIRRVVCRFKGQIIFIRRILILQ